MQTTETFQAVTMENIAISVSQRVCGHCGGILRYYRGSVSCLMCGRDESHTCPNCVSVAEGFKKTA